MSERRCQNWLQSYVDFSCHTEAPKIMHFWAGVWALSGVLRRRVWMDQVAFKWYPNFFIIFVAPPGIVSKSTTAGMAESFLREIPDIKFGPDVVTWPALVTSFANACESFPYGEDFVPMSPLNLIASELGNLIDPRNKEMVNLFIDLWDGRKQLVKETKMSGNDTVEGPWINLLGCTTPHWIADNMPVNTVGGGFTSRCIFVYADKKEQFIAFPKYNFPKTTPEDRENLIHDLEYIAVNMLGEYEPDAKARAWVEQWYKQLWTQRPAHLDDERLDGYIARRQTHLMKLTMVIAAAQRDEMVLREDDFIIADTMLNTIEQDADKVFSKLGRSEESMHVERLLDHISKHGKNGVEYSMAYKYIYSYFPGHKEFENVLAGLIRSGEVTLHQKGVQIWIVKT
jgi:hypothetical protein